MVDLRFSHKNNQKKGVSYFCSGPIALKEVGKDDDSGILFDLPRASYIKSIQVVTLEAGTGPVGMKCGLTVLINDDGIVNTKGTHEEANVNQYFHTGGTVVLRNMATTPKSDTGIIMVMVEYIETQKSILEYTN
ncbi:hypothetical protein GWW53_08455 [Campylobacter jejuni]|nr:hypothetical protein [Campylobacter jejuni]